MRTDRFEEKGLMDKFLPETETEHLQKLMLNGSTEQHKQQQEPDVSSFL